jgi:hypothetical protein
LALARNRLDFDDELRHLERERESKCVLSMLVVSFFEWGRVLYYNGHRYLPCRYLVAVVLRLLVGDNMESSHGARGSMGMGAMPTTKVLYTISTGKGHCHYNNGHQGGFGERAEGGEL